MPVITLGGVDYPAPATPVQADSQATSLEPNMVPTGGTINSVLNNQHGYVTGSISSGVGWTLFKQGSLRILNLLNYSGANGSIVIPEGHRPKANNSIRMSQVEAMCYSNSDKKVVSVAVGAASGSVGCIDVAAGTVISFVNVRGTVTWSVD